MVLLAVVVVAVGPLLLARLPLEALKVVIGTALLLFGLEWLRKGILRLAGRRSLSNSFQEYIEEREALEAMEAPAPGEPDWPARIVAGKGVLLEGVEVVLIVAALGAGPDGLTPAIAGAALAVVVVVGVGFALHRPLMRLPESHLKYAVGVVLSSFGVFFLGEGLGTDWPGGDVALLYVAATLLAVSQAADRDARARAGDGLMRALRKLVLGETVALPVGVAIVLAVGLVLREVGGDWWEDDGGFVLLALVVGGAGGGAGACAPPALALALPDLADLAAEAHAADAADAPHAVDAAHAPDAAQAADVADAADDAGAGRHAHAHQHRRGAGHRGAADHAGAPRHPGAAHDGRRCRPPRRSRRRRHCPRPRRCRWLPCCPRRRRSPRSQAGAYLRE